MPFLKCNVFAVRMVCVWRGSSGGWGDDVGVGVMRRYGRCGWRKPERAVGIEDLLVCQSGRLDGGGCPGWWWNGLVALEVFDCRTS